MENIKRIGIDCRMINESGIGRYIYNLVKNSILNDDINDKCPEDYKEFANNIRNEYLPLEYEKSFYYDCKKDCNLNVYLKIMIKMNLEIEKYSFFIEKADIFWLLKYIYLLKEKQID